MQKILIIEDDLEVAENVIELLQLNNFAVFAASGGVEGLQVTASIMPDVILCDITMQGMDGFGFLQNMHRYPETAHIPVIFLTARTDARAREKAVALGASGYITKPFTCEELLEAIANCGTMVRAS